MLKIVVTFQTDGQHLYSGDLCFGDYAPCDVKDGSVATYIIKDGQDADFFEKLDLHDWLYSDIIMMQAIERDM